MPKIVAGYLKSCPDVAALAITKKAHASHLLILRLDCAEWEPRESVNHTKPNQNTTNDNSRSYTSLRLQYVQLPSNFGSSSHALKESTSRTTPNHMRRP
jgi:hypothetical protein